MKYSSRSLIFKIWIFVILSMQTTVTLLLMRYSRMDVNKYSGSSAVLHSEIIKYLFFSILLLHQSDLKIRTTFTKWKEEVILKPQETFKLFLPGLLYTIQNNLLYYSMSVLNVAIFQITYQLKILTTGLFMGLLLKKWLRPLQWLSIFGLTLGVTMVQINANIGQNVLDKQSTILGLFCVLFACFTSAFAGVYYEMLVKMSNQPSVVIRNMQLGIFTIVQSLIAHFYYEKSLWFENLYKNFDVIVWVIVILQAGSGIFVSAIIKYTDNIQKGFATSLSIIISSVISTFVFRDLTLGPGFITGTIIVISSIVGYGYAQILPVSTE